jgi:MFS family permease
MSFAPASAALTLTHNQGFRRLWLGDAISLLGDWFTYVAVGVLALEADQGLVSVAIVLLGHSLPRAVFAPLAGRLADRYDRRSIMIVASLLRAISVVAMIAAAHVGALGILQVLLFVRMAFGAFIDPAATAMLPQLVAREQIGRANAILGATWSVMFGVGVVAGGAMTVACGPIWSLGIDALTFVIAAGVFAMLPPAPPTDPLQPATATSRGGWAIAWAKPEILQAALAKLPAALANGGAWVLLHQLAGAGQFGATGIGLGLLHAARAVGTGLGPLLWVGPLRASVLGLRLSTALTLVSVGLFALADTPALALLAACSWGVGVGANWVAASTRTQLLTDNDQLGRVASVDLVAHSLGQCAGGLGGAWLADHFAGPQLTAWWGVGAGLIAWAGIGALVRLSNRAVAIEG